MQGAACSQRGADAVPERRRARPREQRLLPLRRQSFLCAARPGTSWTTKAVKIYIYVSPAPPEIGTSLADDRLGPKPQSDRHGLYAGMEMRH